MNRREVIQKAALAIGYTISGPALLGVLNGCHAKPDLVYKPDFFTEDQARTISELAEILMPRTNTPGAKDAGVPGFIDSMVKEVYSQKEKDDFLEALAAFDAEAKKDFGDSFGACSKEDRFRFVKKKHEEAMASIGQAGIEGWWNRGSGDENNKPFVVRVKELTLLGFFTSEPGATQVLQYNQVPGPYQGCLPLEKVGKAWAT